MVSVKVPAFWPESAEAWFIQVKAQFALKGVTASSTKFSNQIKSQRAGMTMGSSSGLEFQVLSVSWYNLN